MNPETVRDHNVMEEPPQFLIYRGDRMVLDRHNQGRVGMCLITKQFSKNRNHE